MPHPKRNRGKAPNDEALFSEKHLAAIAAAVEDFSYLLSRNYGENSALQIVGDRYQLTKRQRMMVLRASCSDTSKEKRQQSCVLLKEVAHCPLFLDGLNLLITIECALSGGVLFKGRDGVVRDIAGVHGTYRKGKQTAAAIQALISFLKILKTSDAHFFLDAPVSGSGRVKQMLLEECDSIDLSATAALVNNPDKILVETTGIVVTSDGWILDNSSRWLNLVSEMYRSATPSLTAQLIDCFSDRCSTPPYLSFTD